MKRKLLSAMIGALCLGAIGSISVVATNQGARAAADEIPTFKYDPDWPKPLPNGWTTGVIGAIYITKDDHIWLATRPSAVTASTETYLTDGLGECCAPAPPEMWFKPGDRSTCPTRRPGSRCCSASRPSQSSQ